MQTAVMLSWNVSWANDVHLNLSKLAAQAHTHCFLPPLHSPVDTHCPSTYGHTAGRSVYLPQAHKVGKDSLSQSGGSKFRV